MGVCAGDVGLEGEEEEEEEEDREGIQSRFTVEEPPMSTSDINLQFSSASGDRKDCSS